MRVLMIAVATTCLIFCGGCNRKDSQSEVEVTAELQQHCILRALTLAFKPSGMQDVRRQYRDDKPITVVFMGFPHPLYPDQFGEHQLNRITNEEADRRIKAEESVAFMRLIFNDRRLNKGIFVGVETHGYYSDSKQEIFRRAHGEYVSVEFQTVDGKLDQGAIGLRAIE